jgi:hypothetical protein
LGIWLCLTTKNQDKSTIYWLLTNPLKMWQSSNIWKWPVRNQNCIHKEIKEKIKFKESLLWFSSGSFVFPPCL